MDLILAAGETNLSSFVFCNFAKDKALVFPTIQFAAAAPYQRCCCRLPCKIVEITAAGGGRLQPGLNSDWSIILYLPLHWSVSHTKLVFITSAFKGIKYIHLCPTKIFMAPGLSIYCIKGTV